MHIAIRHPWLSLLPIQLAWLSLLLAGALAQGAQAATVERFSPQGEIRSVRQVAVRFSEDMVKFGDPRAPSPFAIDCAETGQGRWLDARAWVFDFNRDLPPGLRCAFKLKPETRALGGAALSGKTDFSFSTGGPAVLSSQPHQGGEVDEEQVFILRLNGPAHEPSVLANAWCVAEGIGERIPVAVTGGKARADFFKALKRDKDHNDAKLLLLKCQQRLPPGARLTLVWGKGIGTAGANETQRVATSQDQPLKYQVRPEFKISFSCARENADAPCSPYQAMQLVFSSAVPRAMADGIRIKTSAGEVKPFWNQDNQEASVTRLMFKGPFPESAELSVTLPAKFSDDAGRAAVNASSFPLKTRTGEGPPLVKFAANFGIIELAQPVLPVTLRNVEPQLTQTSVSIRAGDAAAPNRASSTQPSQGPALSRLAIDNDASIIEWLGRLRRAERDEFKSRETPLIKGDRAAKTGTLPAPGAGKTFEVVGIPLPEPGFHVVELESERLGAALLGKARPMYLRAGALVTNMAVHFKMGRADAPDSTTPARGSAVWVTTLDQAKPVAGAALRLSDCRGHEIWSGQTDAQGVAMIQLTLHRNNTCDTGAPAYFVSARKGADMSFALSDWQDGIEPWRFSVNQGYQGDEGLVAHTVFDRPLLRTGETLSMKHYLRQETLAGFAPPGPNQLPSLVRISHVGSGTDYDLPLAFGARGSAAHSWKVPSDAKLGEYSVTLLHGDSNKRENFNRQILTGVFRVAEFRLPLMQGAVTPPKEAQVKAAELPFNLALSYLSGGPAPGHVVKLTALLRSKRVSFADHEGFSFEAAGDPGDAADPTGDPAQPGAAADRLVADKQAVTLGPDGTARFVAKGWPASQAPRELLAEMTYRDPNGEEQTLRGASTLWPAAVVVGLKTEDWVQVKKKARLQVLALGLDGKPRADVPLSVRGALLTTLSTRKRSVGGFYTYDNKTEQKDLGELCSGKSDARGLLLCEATLGESGNVKLTAQAQDAQGNQAVASSSIWVSGSDWWFGGDNDDRIDLLPEKKRYAAGESARLQVRSPFRNATAWVAIEREGVIETLVLPISGKDPVIALPIKPGYAPNVFVSVLAVRARVREVPWYSFLLWGWRAPFEWWGERREWVDQYHKGEATALVDLAKPAFKFGIAELQVGTAAFELKVNVSADKAVYQTRETAKVSVSVKGPDGKSAPEGTEVALAAVDQALLELMPNDSWNILEAMLKRRSYFVETATAQMQVIGRRHFGKKALPPGGGGGRAPTRELFDTLLLWHPSVRLDANGEAQIDVPLNDALTSFRIVAIADTASSRHAGLFGSGFVTVRATKDLQILAGLPPLAREGDQFRAGVTLRNTTSRPMRVAVSARIQGLDAQQQPQAQAASLAPGQAQEVFWPVTVPLNVTQLGWTFDAVEQAVAKPARDAMKAAQRIVPAVPVTVQQATLLQLDKSFSLAVAPPGEAVKDGAIARGGLRVALLPKLSGSLDGVRRYFENYPFICLEQKVSKAIGLRDQALWSGVVQALPNYLDEDGLAAYFPGGRGSDTLTAYLLAASHEAGYAIADNTREHLEGGLIAFVEGRIQRDFWSPVKDLDARKISAIEALSRSGKATPRLLESLTLLPNLWPTHALVDWLAILQRLPAIPRREDRLAEAEQILRARLSMQGTKLVFSTERDDYWWWLMVGGDVNAARLIAAVLERPAWRDDMPRLVSGLLARQNKGAWQTTTANLWGGLALDKFAARFESEKVAGTTRAAIEASGPAKPTSTTPPAQALAWATQAQGGALNLPWPAADGSIRTWHEGAGKPWLTLQSLAAIPLKTAFAAGYSVAKTLTPIEQKTTGLFTRGDVWRVKLEVDASADMTWVVVADPVPAGATILGAGLARDASSAQQGERKAGQAWPAFEERSFEAFRAYYEYAPKGKWSLEYTMRLNQDGDFSLPPTRVEAMYAPEMFGVAPNARMKVLP
jgi:uncharacterized protein YfaS (alpha-2-macroglobulin family)